MKNKREKGEVVVEASIVVTLVVIFITVMLYIGMVLYQKTLIEVMANQTAANIAQVYSNNLKDPFTGYVDPDRAYQAVTYTNFKTDEYVETIEKKANVFAQYRLKTSAILNTGDPQIEVQLVKKPNELLKSQIVVTISDEYMVSLARFFGVDGKMSFSATGRADCVDYLEYMQGVEAVGNKEVPPISALPATAVVTFVKSSDSAEIHARTSVIKGQSIVSSNSKSHSSMPKPPSFKGLEFAGWYTEDGILFTESTQVDGNITVYGKWKCKVTFVHDDGTGKVTEKTAHYMNTLSFPIPTRDGYNFLGWFTQKNGGGEEYTSDTTLIKGDVTLYANWLCTHEDGYVGKPKEIEKGNCQKRSVFEYTCARCGNKYQKEGNFGGHVYSALCGEIHVLKTPFDLSSRGSGNHSTGAGYIETKAVECYVCIGCGKVYGKPYFDVKDGKGRSRFIVCRRHANNYGDYVYDSTDSGLPKYNGKVEGH